MTLHSNGLDLELHTRRLSGPLIPGRHPRVWIATAAQAPAAALIGLVVVVPAIYTAAVAAWTRPALGVGCVLLIVGAITPLVAPAKPAAMVYPISMIVAAAGLLLLVGVLHGDVRRAYVLTLGWVGYAAILVCAALAIAWFTRGFRWVWRPLILPFGISAFTAGIAFRFVFDRLTAHWDLGSVGHYQLGFEIMLGVAFAWTWAGLLTGLFRAALRAIDSDPVRGRHLAGVTGRAAVVEVWKLVRPVRLIAFLVVGIAAARVFDAVLAAVPRSMQSRVDTATAYWWQTTTVCDPSCGETTVYAVPLAVVIVLGALWAQAGIRGHRISWSAPVPTERETGRERSRLGEIVFMAVAVLIVLAPIGVLVWVAITGRGLALGDRALWQALGTTAVVALFATVTVVVAAVPVAHRLAGLRTGFASRIVVPALVILTVLPAQMYLGPLHRLVTVLGPTGNPVPLILTHAAAGLPIAILILRGALIAPAYSPAADALYGFAPPGVITRRLLNLASPALGAVAVLEFIQVWNDFFIGLLIGGPGASPWSVLLWGDARQFNENSAQLAAGALISAAVPVVLLLVCWRRFVMPGLAGGALR